MLNKVGLIGSSWILPSDENFVEIDIVILNLHFVRDDITTNFKKCQFAMAHIASRAGNMYCEWIGGCYVHKSLPLGLSGLKCVFKKLGNIWQQMTHIFKLTRHFGSDGQNHCSEPVRSWVRFSQSGLCWILLNCFIIALFATCAHLGTFLPRACTTSGATMTRQDESPGASWCFLSLFSLFFTTPRYYVSSLEGCGAMGGGSQRPRKVTVAEVEQRRRGRLTEYRKTRRALQTFKRRRSVAQWGCWRQECCGSWMKRR